MPIIDRDAEKLRKERLKDMEDKRVRFAEKLEKDGFAPENMLFCSSEDGRFVALSRHNGGCAVIVGPVFGSEEDFRIEFHERLNFRREDVFIKSEGLGGAFGFGKKGASGYQYFIPLEDGSEVVMSVIAGRTSYLEAPLKKNPLLKTKRRRGDANIVWDMQPIERNHIPKIIERITSYYLPE